MARTEPIRTVDDMLAYFAFIRNKKQEHFVCLSLDSGMRVIKRRVVTIGLLDRVMAHPREVFAGPGMTRVDTNDGISTTLDLKPCHCKQWFRLPKLSALSRAYFHSMPKACYLQV